MWSAIAGTYEEMNLIDEAIACYKRAEANGDREAIALIKLARLHNMQRDYDNAAHYYSMNLQIRDQEGIESQDTVEACMFLVGYYRKIYDLESCEKFASRLLQYGGPEKEEAKSLLREIRTLQNMATTSTTDEMSSYS
eukprot:Sdes_comp19296_c0_seq3m10364